MRRTFEMLMLFVAAFAVMGSEPSVTPDASPVASIVKATASTQVSVDERQTDVVALLIADADAPLIQVAQPLPGSLLMPPGDELPAEPPSCLPRHRAELRRGFVRMLAEIARAVAR